MEVDQKLAELVAGANMAEARIRLEAVLQRRDQLATENYVRFIVGLGREQGFDLTKGDVALIHPKDLPPNVILVHGRDPVFVCNHPEVFEGKLLFAADKVKYRYLAHQTTRH